MPDIVETATSVTQCEPTFNGLSWVVIALYLIATTIMGHVLSRRKMTVRDFFLGGRKLPWPAVCASIIATELSAMTLVGAPAFLWAATGNMTYAILAIGAISARVIVGFWLMPKYYEKEIYSPYQYIGDQLGMRANRLTSFLFMLGGIMGQGTRVLLTAIVLQVVTGIDIHLAIWLVGGAAVVWTCMGGIVTVVWTDVVQFCVFAFSAFITLAIVVTQFETPGGEAGIVAILDLAREAGKLKWFDASLDIGKNYTIWSGLIGATIGGLAAYGADQMMMQRCFCCRDASAARKAIIWSCVGQVLMLICLLVGVGLWAYYQKSGLAGVPNPEELAQIDENNNRLVPVFIKFRVPWFLGGLMVAGIFAAAISSLDSILAALSQQTLAALRGKGDKESSRDVFLGRVFIVFWAIALCGMASIFQAAMGGKGLLIELALSVVGYISGAILGTLLMAAIPRLRCDALGMEWAAALSIMSIFAITRHGEMWQTVVLLVASGTLALTAFIYLMARDRWAVAKLLPFVAFVFFLHMFHTTGLEGESAFLKIGWPWYAPLGCLVMLTASQLLCGPKAPVARTQS